MPASSPLAPALQWLVDAVGIGEAAAHQLVEYLARAHNALGALPTHRRIVLERFFDESGGTQLVVHSPYGSRINKAWGLALRKRFCRTFNFELQAAATEDAIILSLSTSHSFPLIEVSRYLHSATAKDVLVQALLDAPLFGVRWRWAATTALALPRFSGGRKTAPQLQRMKAEDLLATVFPDQVACLENIVGDRQIPDHPLVEQTLRDCLTEAMDAEGWLDVLRGLESGAIEVVARDLPEPSPLAAEILTARPYAFLDDAPLEERRTQAVQMRRWSDPESAADLGALDADAIDAVREEAWPDARDDDEMHEVLTGLGFVTAEEAKAQPGWLAWLQQLARNARATRLDFSTTAHGPRALWCAAERLPLLQAIHADTRMTPAIVPPPGYAAAEWTREDALVEVVRARLGALGPVSVATLADTLAVDIGEMTFALATLEREGHSMRGRFTPGASDEEWCERHLLARINRYTHKRLRREIEPVEPRDFMRFLFTWQHVDADARMRGPEALPSVLGQLEGYEAAAGAWETEIFERRISDYSFGWIDDLCRSGRAVWTRIADAATATRERAGGPVRATPIVLLPRRAVGAWISRAHRADIVQASSRARAVLDHLQTEGASFFDEIAQATRLLETELEEALGELVARGLVNSDGFAGLRALLQPASRRRAPHARRVRRANLLGIGDAGRWSATRAARPAPGGDDTDETTETIARALLRRYGVVSWRLLAREAEWLPPWRDLVRVYRRLEARGEIRGGRFVHGLSGEQFALPEAIPLLRKARAQARDGTLVVIAATDPLNLVGIVTAGARVAAIVGTRILFEDGVPIATAAGGRITRISGSATDAVPTSWSQALSRRSGEVLAEASMHDPREPAPATPPRTPETERKRFRP